MIKDDGGLAARGKRPVHGVTAGSSLMYTIRPRQQVNDVIK
jgi:hypothetical protein